jgi:formylglycine-generating enzyme required for sulfatase activity
MTTRPPLSGRARFLALLAAAALAACVQDWSRPWRLDGATPDSPRRVDAPPGSEGRPFDGPVGWEPDWVTIPSGPFTMGSPESEPCRPAGDAERDHPVVLTRRYELQRTEATRGEYQLLVGSPPAAPGCRDPQCPAAALTWHHAAAYCNALSARAKLTRCYTCTDEPLCSADSRFAASIYKCPGYRLPTDAEWERAYRAGSTSALHGGAVTSCEGADPLAGWIAWYGANSGGVPHPVGLKLPNAWGLRDMAGNLLEWCHDERVTVHDPVADVDPVGLSDGLSVLRGGSYRTAARSVRAAAFEVMPQVFQSPWLGVRCARTSPVAQQSITSKVLLPTKNDKYALDLDGTGPKNMIGDMLAQVTDFGIDLRYTQDLSRGRIIGLFELYSTSLTDEAEVVLQSYAGKDLDTNPRNNFSGSAKLAISEVSTFEAVAKGTLAGGKLTVTGRMPVPLPSGLAKPDPALVLWKARVEALVTPRGLRGVLGGVISGADYEKKLLPAAANAFTWLIDPKNPDLDPYEKSAIIQVLDKDPTDGIVTVDELKNNLAAKLVKPDIDLDGDNALESYSIGIGFETTTCEIVR